MDCTDDCSAAASQEFQQVDALEACWAVQTLKLMFFSHRRKMQKKTFTTRWLIKEHDLKMNNFFQYSQLFENNWLSPADY